MIIGSPFGDSLVLKGGKLINNKMLTELPGITVIMISCGRNDEWFKMAQRSVMGQLYPLNDDGTSRIELKIAQNNDREFTIGQCWNRLIADAKHDYVFIMDDDDWIAQDYLLTLMLHLIMARDIKKQKDTIGVTSHLTLFEQTDKKVVRTPTYYYSSGMIEKKWLKKIPFAEDINSQVDIRWDEDVKKAGKKIAIAYWNFGYFYRQHDQMVSGRNMEIRMKQVEIEHLK